MKISCVPLFNSVIFVFLCIICLGNATPRAEMKEVGEIFYRGDINELKNSTVSVPDFIVAMSKEMRVVPEHRLDSTPDLRSMSVFFIIQHSESMIRKDPEGKRFSVASALLDTLYKYRGNDRWSDTIEVGLAIFREYLYFDPEDNPLYTKTPEQDTGAYLPLIRIDSSYAPDGKNGLVILKELLATQAGQANELIYQPSFNNNSAYSNINAGFNAAQHAFKKARARPGNQMIVFFSDGEANKPLDSPNSYIDDVKTDVPTTFTYYFTDNGMVPNTLQDMTNNLKLSNYSTGNDSSNLFTIDLGMNHIGAFLYERISGGSKFYMLRPFSLTMNGSTGYKYDSLYAFFICDNHFPLTNNSNTFTFSINYFLTHTGDTTRIDSIRNGAFDITIQPGSTLPDTFALLSWQRGLDFYNNGSLISTANETITLLEVRFECDTGAAGYKYTNATVELKTLTGSNQDKETFTLTANGDYFTKTFPLLLITDTQEPIQNDGTLQCHETDSIIAVFRNSESPRLPLDTLREALPYNGTIGIHNRVFLPIGKMYYTLSTTGIGNYTLRFFNLPDNGNLFFYTISGKKILQQNIAQGNSQVIIPANISSSVVFMKLEYNEEIIKQKLYLQ